METLGEEALVNDVVEEGGLARAGDAGQADQAAERQLDIEIAEVVFGGVFEMEPRGGERTRRRRRGRRISPEGGGDGPTRGGDGNGFAPGWTDPADCRRRRARPWACGFWPYGAPG